MLAGPPPKFHGTRDILLTFKSPDAGLCQSYDALEIQCCVEAMI